MTGTRTGTPDHRAAMARTRTGTPHSRAAMARTRTGTPDGQVERQVTGTGPRRRSPLRGGRRGLPWGRGGGLMVPTLLLAAGGLLLTAGAKVVQSTWAPAAATRTVVLTMHHTRFQPAVVKVEPGTTVRFVLRNTDPIDHEFIVGDEAVHQRHRVGRDRHHHGEVPGEISVPSGTQAATTYRFDRPGRFAYACHLPGHEAYGMVGTVEVG
jgi:uncharacterized cupredoxin-like copper-binding protein